MMERMYSNMLAEGDPLLPDDDKIDFDRNDFKNIMDSTELDKALSEDVNWGDFNFDDADIDKMVNPDDLSLEGLGSDGSFDGLANMPIVEVDDDQVEQLLGHIAKEENISVPSTPNYQNHNSMHLEADDPMFEAQPDPLLGRLSRRGSSMYGASTATQPPFTMQDMVQEVDALQRLVDDAVMHARTERQEPQVGMNNQTGLLDLEQEKLRLLSRLNEINQRQHHNSTTADPFQASGAMSHLSSRVMRQQTQQQEPPKAAVASIGTMNRAGETPLTSFLRKNQKTQPNAATTATIPSMNHPSASGAASIFAESPMSFDNPLLRGSHTKQNTLFGAMDRTSASQEMVRKLSARSLLARSDSGQNIRGGFTPNEMRGANQTWGDTTTTQRPTTMSFKTSGILPRHASDNHVLRAGTKGTLIRSRSKNTSLSRENLLYMKKTSQSRNNSDDSLGSLLPVKRAGGTKYKVGISRSTPRLTMNGPHSGHGGHGGSQMNAMW